MSGLIFLMVLIALGLGYSAGYNTKRKKLRAEIAQFEEIRDNLIYQIQSLEMEENKEKF